MRVMPDTSSAAARVRLRPVAALSGAAMLAVLAGCGSDSSPSGASSGAGGKIAVTATDTTCEAASTTLPAGSATFTVTNRGSKITEMYVYAPEGQEFDKVVSEVENVGPGTSRDLTVSLADGTYELACKPGQSGDGIRTRLTVGSGTAPNAAAPSASASSGSAAPYDREIELSTDGRTITGSPGTARTGEKIEFKLENESNSPRILEIKKPDGSVAAETKPIPADAADELVLPLDVAGNWQLIVEATGQEDVTSVLRVS